MVKCPICNNQIQGNATVCPYCETIINKPASGTTVRRKSVTSPKEYFIKISCVAIITIVISTICAIVGLGPEGGFMIGAVLSFGLVGVLNIIYGFRTGIGKGFIILLLNFAVFMIAGFAIPYLYESLFPFILGLALFVFLMIVCTCIPVIIGDNMQKGQAVAEVDKVSQVYMASGAQNVTETSRELKELKNLYDSGVITKSEFKAKKKQILGI